MESCRCATNAFSHSLGAKVKTSLVIPVKDEENSIGKLLESIMAQTEPPDEIVFVDAGSTDNTVDIIKRYIPGGVDIRIISIGPAYPGVARNAGVGHARNDLVAFTDGGIELDKDWLKELVLSMLTRPDCDVVYGYYSPKTDTLFKKCLSMAVVAPVKLTLEGRVRPRFIASSLLRRSAWAGAGGFPDLRAAEDRIFMENIEKKGFRTAYNPRAVVIWDIPSGPVVAFRRFYSYSYHDAKANRFGDWHLPVLKMYLAATLFAFLGLIVSPAFYIVILAGLGARIFKKILNGSSEPYFKLTELPSYIVLTGFLIILVDMALFAGWLKYITERIKND